MIGTILSFVTLLFINYLSIINASSCQIDVDTMISKDVTLQGYQFWVSRSHDVMDCARLCVKRKPCLSFNYNSNTGLCELNNGTYQSAHQIRSDKSTVYSRIADWPAQIEPECFGRPCDDDEICVPGHLAGNTQCSYACLKVAAQPQAPLPTTAASSTVAGTPVTATTTVSPTTTTPVPTTTSPVPTTTTPVPTTTTTTPVPTTTTTTAAPTTTTAAPTTTTAAPTTTTPVPTTTAAAPTTTAAAPTTTTTTAAPTTTTTTAAPTTTTAAPTTTTSTTTSTTTTTPAPTTTTIQTNGLQLVGGVTPNEGRLEMLKADQDTNWRSVQLEDGKWNWKTTAVVCRQLGFQYGGSYHDAGKPFAAGSYKSYKLNNVNCAGTESSLFDCPIDEYKEENSNSKDIGITCFTEDVDLQGYDNIHLVDDSSGDTESNDGYLMIRYQTRWTRVCETLIDKAPDVFCKTISQGTLEKDNYHKDNIPDEQMWVKKIDCKYEDVPHPFFCKNEGWRLESCGKSATLSCKS